MHWKNNKKLESKGLLGLTFMSSGSEVSWLNVPAMKQDKPYGSDLSQSHPCARPERDPLMSMKLMYCGLWYKATVIDFLFNHKLQLP